MKTTEPTSKKPYFIRALYEWIVDNDMTPMVVVDANAKGLLVPPHVRKGDQVIFNLAPISVFGLNIGNDSITFRASFSGAQHNVSIPTLAIFGLYPRENLEHGMLWGAEDENTEGAETIEEASPGAPRIRAVANIGSDTLASGADANDKSEAPAPATASVDEEPTPPPPKARPTLRVVK